MEHLEPLGHLIDQALQHVSDLAGIPTRAERKARATERSRAEEAARRRRDELRAAQEQEAIEQRRNFLGVAVRNPLRVA
jgi:hypothetical protein